MNLQEQLQEKIAEIATTLETSAPGLPNLLRTIHTQLKKDPELVTLLTDEECSVLVNGLKEHTQIELACTAMKSAPRKALKNTTVDDL